MHRGIQAKVNICSKMFMKDNRQCFKQFDFMMDSVYFVKDPTLSPWSGTLWGSESILRNIYLT